ncbi:hypothetical protein SAMN02745166_03792 [Prosthecobacter debontii]|uniref:Uncharacterized protein n=1 Tax=Prosthecobacter debontii TaxID=48467 RepID=A0A1T4YMX4_9BACT|nr:hypothetical protein [Prosthecobacter debontii]SKB03177.1 hypothetical protein SAMN02745166_03792 [Prosthecobacter debontii]
MILADIDPVQIIIIVIAMGAGFLQWLWGLIQQKLEEGKRQNMPLSEEERAAREAAWKQQTQQERTYRPPTQAPTPTYNPWETVRDVFEQARRAQESPAPPQRPTSPPPPLPQSQRTPPGTVRADLRPAPPPVPSKSEPFPVTAKPAKMATPPVFFDAPIKPPLATRQKSEAASPYSLKDLLHNPAAARQAILLREILGPPKALQSSGDSPF